jgi:hypothetical protein
LFGFFVDDPRRLPARPPVPQFPALLRRAAHFPDRHLDAECGASVAGVPAHGIAGAAGRGRFRGQIPVFLLAPVGGVVADRYSRHRLVIATQTASMLLAFALAALTPLTGTVRVWHIFVLAALLGW